MNEKLSHTDLNVIIYCKEKNTDLMLFQVQLEMLKAAWRIPGVARVSSDSQQ